MTKMDGLTKIRKKKKLSQQKVAEDLCIRRETLSHYENGRRSPDIDMLLSLSNYFGVSVDYLIKGREFSGLSDNQAYTISNIIDLIKKE